MSRARGPDNYHAKCGARGQGIARRGRRDGGNRHLEERSTVTVDTTSANEAQTLDQVVIRFAGDSGDGMQLVGDRFTEISAAFGNDLATLPNYPAEIRAPAGTIAGVSSFQVHIADF